MFFLIYAQRWKVTKTIYERYDSCEVEFNALCCIGYPVIVSSVITERKGHKKRLIQRSQSRFNNHKGGNCSGKLPLMFRFGQINASSERLTVLCLRFKKKKQKSPICPFSHGGAFSVHVFRCQKPKEVLKKKKFTVLYRVPNLKKDWREKERRWVHISVFWCSFFVFSCVSCPFK